MNRDRVTTYLNFIQERESIRLKRAAGHPRPWTMDPVLARYKFTNVHREHDRTTMWVDENVIKPYESKDLFEQIYAIFAARMFNRIETMNTLMGWWPIYRHCNHPIEWLIKVMEREAKSPYCTGAFIILGVPGMTKLPGVLHVIDGAKTHLGQIMFEDTCEGTFKKLRGIPYIADFMAAQFVADYKNSKILKGAEDWWTFSVPGPGSTRGMNWLLDRDSEKSFRKEGWDNSIRELQLIIEKDLGWKLDAQNIQNTLCELSKYVRGFSRNTFKPYSGA